MSVALAHYDAACRAIAEARSVDEVKDIRDAAIAMAAYARQAKNRDLEADAVAIRMRATRRLDQLRQAQKETVGLATGGEHGGRGRIDGVRKTPSIVCPTLAMQGIDKNLAKQARALGALSEKEFEAAVADAHDRVARAMRNTVREIEIGQKRESPRAVQRKATEAETKAARKVDEPKPRDDIGPASTSEMARKDAEIEELRNTKRRLEIENVGLRSAAAKPAPQSKSASRCSICHEKKPAVLRPFLSVTAASTFSKSAKPRRPPMMGSTSSNSCAGAPGPMGKHGTYTRVERDHYPTAELGDRGACRASTNGNLPDVTWSFVRSGLQRPSRSTWRCR